MARSASKRRRLNRQNNLGQVARKRGSRFVRGNFAARTARSSMSLSKDKPVAVRSKPF